MSQLDAQLAFEKNLDAFLTNVIEQDVPYVLRYLGLEMFTRLVRMTPVDTGRAQGGWQMLVGVAPTEDSNVLGAGPALAAAAANVAAVKYDDIIFIGNPVFYIVFLDQGSSQQAPLGMTDIALAEVSQLILPIPPAPT